MVSVQRQSPSGAFQLAIMQEEPFMVDSEKLATLESLTNIRVTNSFVTMSSMLQWVSEVKHLFIKVEAAKFDSWDIWRINYESNFYNFYRKLAYCTNSVIQRDYCIMDKSAEVQFLQVMPQS
ncbi:PREDICTED: uncharacterized protein LOC101309503 [Fragaria vesca subsp. vesca]